MAVAGGVAWHELAAVAWDKAQDSRQEHRLTLLVVAECGAQWRPEVCSVCVQGECMGSTWHYQNLSWAISPRLDPLKCGGYWGTVQG